MWPWWDSWLVGACIVVGFGSLARFVFGVWSHSCWYVLVYRPKVSLEWFVDVFLCLGGCFYVNVIFQDVLGPDFRVRSQYTEQPNVCQPSFLLQFRWVSHHLLIYTVIRSCHCHHVDKIKVIPSSLSFCHTLIHKNNIATWWHSRRVKFWLPSLTAKTHDAEWSSQSSTWTNIFNGFLY